MDKIRFTAGEWKIREIKGDSWPDNRISIGPEDDHKATAVAISPRYAEREQMLADAHLIAAAPELYEALCRASKWIDDCGAQGGVQAILDDIEFVLAKARGEQQ